MDYPLNPKRQVSSAKLHTVSAGTCPAHARRIARRLHASWRGVREAASDRGQACHALLATMHQPTISGRTTAGATLTCALARVHRETVRIRFPNEPSAPSAPSRPPSNGAPSCGRPQPVPYPSARTVALHMPCQCPIPFLPRHLGRCSLHQCLRSPPTTGRGPRDAGGCLSTSVLRRGAVMAGVLAILVHLTLTSRKGWRCIDPLAGERRRPRPREAYGMA